MRALQNTETLCCGAHTGTQPAFRYDFDTGFLYFQWFLYFSCVAKASQAKIIAQSILYFCIASLAMYSCQAYGCVRLWAKKRGKNSLCGPSRRVPCMEPFKDAFNTIKHIHERKLSLKRVCIFSSAFFSVPTSLWHTLNESLMLIKRKESKFSSTLEIEWLRLFTFFSVEFSDF